MGGGVRGEILLSVVDLQSGRCMLGPGKACRGNFSRCPCNFSNRLDSNLTNALGIPHFVRNDTYIEEYVYKFHNYGKLLEGGFVL